MTITTKASDIVTAVRFTEGRRVREGDVLMELDSGAIRAEIHQASAQADNARALPAGAIERRLADMEDRAPVILDEAAKLVAKSKPGDAPAE